MKKMAISVISIGLICIFSGAAFGAIFKVPSVYSTIQAGIDAASNGDTVLVADGVYIGEGNRDLVFGGKIITLQSENGPANSIIDCQGVGRALSSKYNTSARDVVIRGFTIKNGVADRGGAIYWGYTSANLTVEDCIFHNNSNAAIRTYHLEIDSTVTIRNCDFIGNEGAVYPMNGGNAVITDCVFDGNTATSRVGAIRATGGTKTDIKNCIFTGNISDYDAGAISFEMGNHRLANCIFAGNRAGGRGGAIYTSHLLDLKGSLTIINSTFSDNKAHTGGAIWLSSDSFPIITNSILWENKPNEIAGGGGVPAVTYSDVMTASEDPYPGEDNINSNPMFFAHGYWDDNGTPSDPSDDFWVDGDYHLKKYSPCIDAGTSENAPDNDIDGDLRPQGAECDIGADEYVFVANLSEIIGTWSSGIWYFDVAKSKWTKMTSYTTDGDMASGDFTGDKKADVASCWDSGLWYQNGATLGWKKVTSTASNRLTTGDVTGDGRAEIIGTWNSGVWFWNAAASSWKSMTSWVTTGDIAAGDITGDGKADVASCWPGYGLYYQNAATFGWQRITTYIPSNVAVGDLTGDGKAEVIGTFDNGIWYWNPATGSWKRLTGSGFVTDGDIAVGDFTGDGRTDTVSCWSNGLWMVNGKTGAWTQVYDTAPYRVTAGDVTGN